jgi:tetratricopeptide (TPR) repeat protein
MFKTRRINRGILSALLCAITAVGPSAIAAQEPDLLPLALAVYKQKDYGRAGEAFYRMTVLDPRNVEAHFYYGNCLTMLRQTDKALRAYWYTMRKFPNTKRGYEIKEYLKKNDRDYALHLSDPGYAQFVQLSNLPTESANIKVGGIRTGNMTRSALTSSGSSAASSGDIIGEMVKTVRPLKNRPAISSTLIDDTKDALKAYPKELLKVVYDHGCRIYLTPTMIDKEPGLEHTTPPGYMEGHSFKDCPGMFYSGGIVICEFTIGNGFDWEKTHDPIGTLRHELGHAIDWYLGQISETEEYKHAYLLDSGAINDDSTRNKLNYYMQKDTRGQHECFAELMAAKYGGRTGRENATNQLVEQSFPLTMKVISKRIAAVQ